MLRISFNVLEIWIKFFNLSFEIFVLYFVFKTKDGIKEIKLVFPHLSPKPLIVPCICLAPALIAANAFATALSVSLWACMPTFWPGISFTTSETIL